MIVQCLCVHYYAWFNCRKKFGSASHSAFIAKLTSRYKQVRKHKEETPVKQFKAQPSKTNLSSDFATELQLDDDYVTIVEVSSLSEVHTHCA